MTQAVAVICKKGRRHAKPARGPQLGTCGTLRHPRHLPRPAHVPPPCPRALVAGPRHADHTARRLRWRWRWRRHRRTSPLPAANRKKDWVLGRHPRVVPVPRDPASVRQPGLVRDGRGTARRTDGHCTRPGQGPLLQLPDHEIGRGFAARRGTVHRLRLPQPHRQRQPAVHPRRVRGEPGGEAGLQRGDEVVAVDQGSGFVPVSQLLANGDAFADLLGPAEVGVQRGLRLLRNGVTFDVQMTKRTVTIDPVVLVRHRCRWREPRASATCTCAATSARRIPSCVTHSRSFAPRTCATSSSTCATTAAAWSARPN